ncbi:MAG: hypothetical protein M1370_11005 [Bacteroidetes bacterium]|nr:hypothetical protein [Bacteroidota bacterium]MCL5027128.1 hypothetical protein [Chloroflexota bacterium]
MAVDLMAQPVSRRYRAASQALVPPVWLLASLLLLASLGWAYITLSGQVAAATQRVQRLEAQLRSEQTTGDQLRMEIAELRSLDRLVPIGLGQLGMRPPTPAELTFVPMPTFVATGSAAPAGRVAPGAGALAAIQGTRGPQGGSSPLASARMADLPSSGGGWLEQLMFFIKPGDVSASESDYGRR